MGATANVVEDTYERAACDRELPPRRALATFHTTTTASCATEIAMPTPERHTSCGRDLMSLPDELHVRIMLELDFEGLVACYRVSLEPTN